jgi:signal transduction histidine kinase
VKKTFSIRVYLGIIHALLLIISMGALGYVWLHDEYHVITQRLQESMHERARLLSNIVSHEIEEQDEVRIEPEDIPAAEFEDIMSAVYIDSSGSMNELIPGRTSPQQSDLFRQLSDEYQISQYSFATLVGADVGEANIYAAAPVIDSRNQILGKVCLLLPLRDVESYIVRLRWLLTAATIVIACLGVGVSILLTNLFSRQFSHVQRLAATVAEGNYHLRIPESGPTELHDLSHYLNVMADKLQEQLKTRQILLANVAHELARPLTGLLLGVESLRKGAIQDPNLADDMLVSMGQTIKRLEGLVDDITLAALPETRPLTLDRIELAIEPFLKGVATRFWTLAESRGIRIEVRVDADVPTVFADEKRLNQIVGNLVDNAIKFTPRGKVIRLSAERPNENQVRLMVHDGGKGISPEEAEHIFKPFYQGDLGQRLKQGMGLGLSIAQQLAQTHGGTLTLENHPAGGALAILTLPIGNA